MYWPADIGLPDWYVYWNFSFSERNVETNLESNLPSSSFLFFLNISLFDFF